jgi:DNA polymerase sigma
LLARLLLWAIAMVATSISEAERKELDEPLWKSWLGEDNALAEEDEARFKRQAKRNLRIRGLLKGRVETTSSPPASPPSESLAELGQVFTVPVIKERSPDEGLLPPWFVPREFPLRASLRLHEELLDIASFLRPMPHEVAARLAWVASIEAAAKSIWSNCKVFIFGSTSTGLNLSCSDVDVAISDVEGLRATTAMKKLAEILLGKHELSKVQIIQSAKVPLMKLQQRSTGLWADIVVNRMDGLDTSRFICEQLQVFPALAPLVLFLKLFLMQRNLHETFMGGMGSYLLVCVVLSFLQRHPSARNPRIYAATSLGNLLLDFFRYYGQEFRYATQGISVLNGGSVFDRISRGWTATTRTGQPTLCLESPFETTVDIGTKVFKIGVIRAAFNHAYHVLAEIMLTKDPPKGSMLCPQLIRLNHKVVSERYGILKEQPLPSLEASGRPESDDEEPRSKRQKMLVRSANEVLEVFLDDDEDGEYDPFGGSETEDEAEEDMGGVLDVLTGVTDVNTEEAGISDLDPQVEQLAVNDNIEENEDQDPIDEEELLLLQQQVLEQEEALRRLMQQQAASSEPEIQMDSVEEELTVEVFNDNVEDQFEADHSDFVAF